MVFKRYQRTDFIKREVYYWPILKANNVDYVAKCYFVTKDSPLVSRLWLYGHYLSLDICGFDMRVNILPF